MNCHDRRDPPGQASVTEIAIEGKESWPRYSKAGYLRIGLSRGEARGRRIEAMAKLDSRYSVGAIGRRAHTCSELGIPAPLLR